MLLQTGSLDRCNHPVLLQTGSLNRCSHPVLLQTGSLNRCNHPVLLPAGSLNRCNHPVLLQTGSLNRCNHPVLLQAGCNQAALLQRVSLNRCNQAVLLQTGSPSYLWQFLWNGENRPCCWELLLGSERLFGKGLTGRAVVGVTFLPSWEHVSANTEEIVKNTQGLWLGPYFCLTVNTFQPILERSSQSKNYG